MTDDQATHLIRVLENINEQLNEARKHRLQLEDMIVETRRICEGNSNMLADLKVVAGGRRPRS